MVPTARRLAMILLALALPAGGAYGQSVEARVWLDRGEEPVLQRGDQARVYYRTSADAFVAIFHLDTNGRVRLLFPSSPEVDSYVPGGRDFRLLFPRTSQWFVDEDPGMGYFFIVASPEPLDFREFRYAYGNRAWDLSFVGQTVYDDPYVAMDDFVARLIPDWEYADYALDFLTYHVGERHEYPRFLCYDCHGFSPYSTWNPYLSACTSFRVIIYNDPFYYPINRYQGSRVVYVRPPVWQQPRYVLRERRVGESAVPLVQPRPSMGDRPGIPGSAAPRRSTSGIGSGGRVTPFPSRPGTNSLNPRTRPSASPGTPARPGSATGRPTLQRRTPSGRPSTSSGSVRPPERSGTTGTVRVPVRTSPSGAVRPPARSGTGSSGTVRIPGRSGASGTVRPPSRPTGGSAGSVRIPSRPGTGSSGSVRPPSRPTGGSGTVRAPARPTGGTSGTVRRPPTSSGSGTVRRPPVRSGTGSSGSVRPPTRSSAGSSGTVRRPPAASSGGGSTRKPPVRRKPGGGNERP